MSVCQSVCWSVCLPLSLCQSIFLFASLSVGLPVCLPVCQSACLLLALCFATPSNTSSGRVWPHLRFDCSCFQIYKLAPYFRFVSFSHSKGWPQFCVSAIILFSRVSLWNHLSMLSTLCCLCTYFCLLISICAIFCSWKKSKKGGVGWVVVFQIYWVTEKNGK